MPTCTPVSSRPRAAARWTASVATPPRPGSAPPSSTARRSPRSRCRASTPPTAAPTATARWWWRPGSARASTGAFRRAARAATSTCIAAPSGSWRNEDLAPRSARFRRRRRRARSATVRARFATGGAGGGRTASRPGDAARHGLARHGGHALRGLPLHRELEEGHLRSRPHRVSPAGPPRRRRVTLLPHLGGGFPRTRSDQLRRLPPRRPRARVRHPLRVVPRRPELAKPLRGGRAPADQLPALGAPRDHPLRELPSRSARSRVRPGRGRLRELPPVRLRARRRDLDRSCRRRLRHELPRLPQPVERPRSALRPAPGLLPAGARTARRALLPGLPHHAPGRGPFGNLLDEHGLLHALPPRSHHAGAAPAGCRFPVQGSQVLRVPPIHRLRSSRAAAERRLANAPLRDRDAPAGNRCCGAAAALRAASSARARAVDHRAHARRARGVPHCKGMARRRLQLVPRQLRHLQGVRLPRLPHAAGDRAAARERAGVLAPERVLPRLPSWRNGRLDRSGRPRQLLPDRGGREARGPGLLELPCHAGGPHPDRLHGLPPAGARGPPARRGRRVRVALDGRADDLALPELPRRFAGLAGSSAPSLRDHLRLQALPAGLPRLPFHRPRRQALRDGLRPERLSPLPLGDADHPRGQARLQLRHSCLPGLPSGGNAMMIATAQALVLAAATLAAAPSAQRRATGRVRYATAHRLYLDAGARDGLLPGSTLRLLRGDKQVATCRIEAVSETHATCSGAGRQGDAFALPNAPASAPAPEKAAPPLSEAETTRRHHALEAARFAKVEYRGPAPLPAILSGRTEVQFAHTSWGSEQFGPWHEERVDVWVRGAPVAGGFALYADISARRWSPPSGASVRPATRTQLYVWEAELARRPLDGGLTVALGRVRPWSIPGSTVFDGGQAGYRTRGNLEVGVFGGAVPDPSTLAPSLRRATGGAYLAMQTAGGADASVRYLRNELRLAYSDGPELGRRYEGEALAQISLGGGPGLG